MRFLSCLVLSLTSCLVSCVVSWPAKADEPEVKVLFIGDSLTAGYGVRKEEAFPELVEQLLKNSQSDSPTHLHIINGGISGSLSSSAGSRVRYYLKLKPQILVLELGANDALKGTDPKLIKKNLAEAITLAQQNNMKVLLVGMQVFANFGETYTQSFAKIFTELAREKKTKLMPFLLEDVAAKKELMQSDQKHPNALGHKMIAENLIKYLKPMVNVEAQKK